MTLPAKLEDITRATLQALVTDAVRERKTVEYKRDAWDLRSDKGKKEFLADVVSFANASPSSAVGRDFGLSAARQPSNGADDPLESACSANPMG